MNIIAVDRLVLDGDTSVGAALLQEPPGGGVRRVAVESGGGSDVGLVCEDDSQLPPPREMAVGRAGGLENQRYAATVWPEFLVGIVLHRLRCSAGKSSLNI